MLVFSALVIAVMYVALKTPPKLPIYQPSMVQGELVDSSMHFVRKYHTIADFSLVNQNGDTVTQKDYKDKIYIADFFFTTCPDICIEMADNMARLQYRLKDRPDVLLLSHTVFPEWDSVSILKEYAIEKGVTDEKWNLVTGDKKHIYELARKSYLVAKDQPFGGDYDMIHTENFVLVDHKKRIRGYYDGTDWEDMKRLLADVEILSEE